MHYRNRCGRPKRAGFVFPYRRCLERELYSIHDESWPTPCISRAPASLSSLPQWGVHDRGRMFIDRNKPIWGASRIPSVVHNEIPLVMGPDEITELTRDFGQSAANVKRAGLDGVELHGAHSYGLGQFMSPTYNKRDDAYGGTPAKRCQVLIECAEQVA